MVLRLGWYPYLVPDTWLALFIEACRAQIDFQNSHDIPLPVPGRLVGLTILDEAQTRSSTSIIMSFKIFAVEVV